MQYRREIDGLRAVAVSSVILFHAGFGPVTGGFVGVDVFFVISGFLITSLIISEKEAGSFSITEFYERRARRILPALFFVVAICIPFAYWWLTPLDLVAFSRSVTAVSWFTSNLHFLGEKGYFDPVAELKPLLHTWSLAVEEQFYLFYPPLLMLAWYFSRRWLIWIVAAAALASLGFAQWATVHEPELAFFVLPTRAWELLVGAILAIYLAGHEASPAAMRHAQIMSSLGIVLVLFAILTFDGNTPTPGLHFMAPTLGTALIIAFARPGTIASAILGSKPFVWIGLISYSAYLWHWPLFAFARYRGQSEPSAALAVGLIAATFILAYISWRFVEKPFRNRQLFSRTQIFKFAGAGAAITLAVGLLGSANGGFPQRLPPIMAANQEDGHSICRPRSRLPENPDIRICEFGDETATRAYIVYGDSHSRSLTREMDKRLKDQNIRGILFDVDERCEIIPQFFQKEGLSRRAHCQKLFQDLLTYFKKRNAIHIVIAMRWTIRMYPTQGEVENLAFTNSDGATDRLTYREYFTLSPDGKMSIAAGDKREALRQFIEGMLSLGVKVHVVYPIPEIGWDATRMNLWHYLSTGKVLDQLSVDMRDYDERNKFVSSILSEFESRPNFVPIKPRAYFCDTFVKGRCAVQFAGVPYYVDDNHLSTIGSKFLVDAIFADQD
ncbi:acyltransferase [Nordella sp. HKS 07]|uniref:acyltransferase family protein n=1 Tax=Nordella sp. HKS 07 TaxID=2712222 RepID=UPI0013E143F4|nr:acyltransferase family protein [Nordella sp. HKS 07]QIG48627.1 acyltransferase [Nordella sp. HKS 07]